ncbi:hypothetical protein GCM10010211_62620 [Streptomyces albospinus]|uniref:Secreted protein n=1 Tax=Streptomyces albospinus TaxID=285515 RepID=A0ABQ2VJX7_9ACTN|nr:hypothetical protein [Streptomyces albospinus]GGU87853.1 hypothetical protein GCM10010211_62620 [Streptomyces albospinus]
MKQTVKTLGAVALGAVFAATAAGVASAAPVGNSIDTNGVLHSLPVKDATKTIAGASGHIKKDGNGPIKAHLNPQGNQIAGLPVALPVNP